MTDHLTSSQTGTFYFAFGSNLSVFQMQKRCTCSPSSSVPVAVAKLSGWKWTICERGYANIVELAMLSTDAHASAVWGIVYNMSSGDESILDGYEGHDMLRNDNPQPNPDVNARKRKPYLQGDWDYNKHYIPVSAVKWLVDDPSQYGVSDQPGEQITVLAYVDEDRTGEGQIIKSYIGRMNRAIDDGVRLGIPRDWVEQAMRKWVKPGVYPKERDIGPSAGYVPDQETEASEPVPLEIVRSQEQEA